MDIINEHILNIMTEMGPEYKGQKPDNFSTDNEGRYRFDVKYNNGKDTLTMVCDIVVLCDQNYMTIEFNEVGKKRGATTNTGTLKTVSDKMAGIMYCIDYHRQNMSCYVDKIGFMPSGDEKDIESNRRAKAYNAYAKKYLPQNGIEYKGVQDYAGGTIILTSPFGGDADNPKIDYDKIDIQKFVDQDATSTKDDIIK